MLYDLTRKAAASLFGALLLLHATALPARADALSGTEPAAVAARAPSAAADSAPQWFPHSAGTALTLEHSPVFIAGTNVSEQAATTPRQTAAIPLSSPGWMGLFGLTALALVGSRRAVSRFFS
jgi:hypothetical protein